jgi:dTDP-4-dehydrorhamnose reductase
MKILVIGREGQLVRSLVEAGGRRGAELLAVGRPEIDLERHETIAPAVAKIAPDVIVNAAAYTAVDQAEDEPERAFAVNAAGAGEMARAARNAGARLIHISTDYVFDGRGEGAYSEEAETRPLGVYGKSKCEGEERARSEYPDHVIVRTAWVYSPFGKNFLKTMMRLAEGRDEVGVVADQHGSPTSAPDLAEGLLALIERWRSEPRSGLGQTYHLAGSGEASWAEFAAAIFDACRDNGLPGASVKPIGTRDFPTKAPRPANSRLDCAKAERDLGIRLPGWRESTAAIVARLAREASGAPPAGAGS